MTSTRPYLVRAIYEWIVDNDMTPHLIVDATMDGVSVPTEYVEDGTIVLNAGPTAVRDLELGNEWLSFNARFAGVARDIFVPIEAVQAIYARENGQGMYFGEPQAGEIGETAEADAALPPVSSQDASESTDTPPRPQGGPPNLRVIK